MSNKLKSYLGCAAWDRDRARAGVRAARPKTEEAVGGRAPCSFLLGPHLWVRLCLQG